LLGRQLVDADERKGAPPVIVIAHDVWRAVSRPIRRHRSDRQAGKRRYTVVGVMPRLRISGEPARGCRSDNLALRTQARPAINVFGRLAPGVTIELRGPS
jgi:hypothetical protein